jgi:ferritin-like metal-binding protein YciE
MLVESARDLFEHELEAAHDAVSRISSTLPGFAKRANDDGLRSLLDELASAGEEQRKHLEQVFQLLDRSKGGESSGPVGAMLDDLRSMARRNPAPEVLDFYMGEGAGDIAQYLQSAYEALLHLAERSGVTHSSPEIGSAIESSFKQTKRLVRRLEKLPEKLVERVRPT